MRKTEVLAHYGTQQKVAEALTEAGFPISQRGVSGWPDLIPLERAVVIEKITHRKLRVDLAAYESRKQPSQ